MLANATRLTGHLHALERAPVPALAFLISAGFAIGQPILADLIGILRWDQCFCGGAEADWTLGLTAVLWYTATAVPAGLLLARRVAVRPLKARPSEFVSGIVPAALGTLLATPVVAALARSAVVPGVDHPGLVAALGVPVGALIGVVAAFAALASAAVVRGLAASWLWVWSVGLVAGMLLELAESAGAQPLGGIDVAFADGTVAAGLYRVLADAGWLVAVLAPVALAGFVAYRSVRRGSGVVAATLGGAAGTLLILVTYRTQGAASGDWAGIATIELLLSAAVAAVAALVTRYRIGR
jgi:hypothetical protein